MQASYAGYLSLPTHSIMYNNNNNNFILGCCSPLASYNSLTDEHLSEYFSNPRVFKHLRRMGLVSSIVHWYSAHNLYYFDSDYERWKDC